MKKSMLTLLTGLTACTLLVVPHPAFAAEGGYLVLRGGYGWSDDVSRRAEVLEPLLSYEDIWDLGLAYGRQFDWLRLEGEIGYLHVNVDDVIRTDGFSLNGTGQDRHYTLMANAFADWRNKTNFTPFFGGGIGAAYVHHDVRFHRPLRDNTVVSDDHTWTFAWQLMAGVSWSINPHWSLEIAYRYYRADERSHGQTGTTNNAVTTVTVDPHQINFVLLGLRYSF